MPAARSLSSYSEEEYDNVFPLASFEEQLKQMELQSNKKPRKRSLKNVFTSMAGRIGWKNNNVKFSGFRGAGGGGSSKSQRDAKSRESLSDEMGRFRREEVPTLLSAASLVPIVEERQKIPKKIIKVPPVVKLNKPTEHDAEYAVPQIVNRSATIRPIYGGKKTSQKIYSYAALKDVKMIVPPRAIASSTTTTTSTFKSTAKRFSSMSIEDNNPPECKRARVPDRQDNIIYGNQPIVNQQQQVYYDVPRPINAARIASEQQLLLQNSLATARERNYLFNYNAASHNGKRPLCNTLVTDF